MGANYPAGVTSVYGETLALSSSLASLGMPGIETKQAIIYNPLVDFRLHLNPALMAAYVYDDSATGDSKWINKSVILQDRASAGTGTSLDSLPTKDRLFLCFSEVTGGIYVDITDVNGGSAQTITGSYWNGSAWSTLSVTDNTSDSTRSLASSNTITWTAPTDSVFFTLGGPQNVYGKPYVKIDTGVNINEDLDLGETDITMDGDPATVIKAGDYIIIDTEVMYVVSSSTADSLVTVITGALGSTAASHSNTADVYIYNIDGPAVSGFWVELKWSVVMDNNTEIGNIWALNKNTNRGYFRLGQEYFLSFDRRNVGSIEVILSSGTDTLQVTWLRNII